MRFFKCIFVTESLCDFLDFLSNSLKFRHWCLVFHIEAIIFNKNFTHSIEGVVFTLMFKIYNVNCMVNYVIAMNHVLSDETAIVPL